MASNNSAGFVPPLPRARQEGGRSEVAHSSSAGGASYSYTSLSTNSRASSRHNLRRPLRGGQTQCHRVGTKKSAPPYRPRESLLKKLFLRESFGQIRSRQRPTGREVTSKLFSRLPVRLAFCLKDAVPLSAIEAGHIFLGFSKCGQFLLSYTQTSSDLDLATGGADLHIKYNYRLHWWLFVPYRRAKKVAEALLFSDSGVYGGLHISFCQWPGDWSKLVVYATAMPDYESSSSSRPCYLTVTAVPSLDACKDCSRVAASYEEEDVAEGWNSCVRFSCLRHGLTIHTTFDLVSPYPAFEPKVSLKRDNHILVNTGNLVHSLHVQLELLGKQGGLSQLPGDLMDTSEKLGVQQSHESGGAKWSELHVGTSEFTLPMGGADLFSPPMCSPPSSVAHWSATSDSETTDCESEYGGDMSAKRKKISVPAPHVLNEERLEKVAQFVQELNGTPSPPGRRLIMSRRGAGRFRSTRGGAAAVLPSTSRGLFQCHSYESLEELATPSESLRKSMAEKAYELTEADFSDDANVREKLSTFRKKRLAEKTYEFTEDVENVTPLPRLRSQVRRRDSAEQEGESNLAAARSPRSTCVGGIGGEGSDVLRLIQENQTKRSMDEQLVISDPSQNDVLADVAAAVPELLSPGGMLKKDRDQSVIMSPRSSCGGAAGSAGHLVPPRFQVKYTRRYAETDGEMISVVTDIEDDEAGGTYCFSNVGTGDAAGSSVGPGTAGYHTVLPLEVHGSGYQPMSMISNTRATDDDRCGQWCLRVVQRSFDLEVFCYQMAQKLCQAAGKKYWFCNDYDVEVVDLNPNSGDVILVAVVQVSATVFTKKVSQRDKCAVSSLHRLQYQVIMA